MNKGYLYLVTLPGITCGVVVNRGKVISAPPVVKGCKGWEIKRFREWIVKGKNFSTNNTGNRRKSDFYETPYSLTRLLLEKEKLVGAILEPAVGGGAIGKVLNEYQYSYTGYDVENDFLKQTQKYDTIITNPPYSLSQKFILKAKENARKKIVFLLPLSYLHGKKRYDEIWLDRTFPLARIYVFTRYPLLGERLRQDGKHNTGMMVYAWYIWERDYKGEPTIKWLDNNEFILPIKR